MTLSSYRPGISDEPRRLHPYLAANLLVIAGSTFLAIPLRLMVSSQGRVAVFLSGAIIGESAAFYWPDD